MLGWVNHLLYSGQACSKDKQLLLAAALDTQITFLSAHQQTEHEQDFTRSGPEKESRVLNNGCLTFEPEI
ncbi:hypothetical protein ASPFODRAFT_694542 [Aspergillus luchuensis CBS 106.47]|uniref:Uncharacterized protein n=1 Tax=Aspergillus luchuensis (strain CBS 106.47) TaxID=1137211 RepID=A0A1M3SYC2_ASPLC|nr:hypothetical protein ASPFODRAFT_694542 [Aspergillus luchuensis CBS 106.47]